jgi:hypothetical protein
MSARLISSQNLPILENGDRVTRDEFERRYHRMPNVKKAELIEGVVNYPQMNRAFWKSPFFAGLWLDVSALLAGNRQQVLTVLQEGINSPEHQTFVEALTTGKSTL